MKKVNVLVILAFIASLGIFSSCDTTEDALGAEIEFLGGNGEDLTVTVGEAANFKFLATEGEAKLESITVEMTGGANLDHVVLFNSADSTGLDLTKSIEINKVMDEVGTYKFTITVVDKAEVETKEEILVTVTDAASDIETYSAKMLYVPESGDADVKSFFSTSTGEVLTEAEFAASVAKVDFGYFYGPTKYATLASTDDYLTTAQTAGYPTSGLNKTRFASTEEAWANIVNLKAAYEAGTAATDGDKEKGSAARISNLKDGDVVLFKTEAGKYGAVLVKEVKGTYDAGGSLEIDVKVEK